jgi:hypothetical protein
MGFRLFRLAWVGRVGGGVDGDAAARTLPSCSRRSRSDRGRERAGSTTEAARPVEVRVRRRDRAARPAVRSRLGPAVLLELLEAGIGEHRETGRRKTLWRATRGPIDSGRLAEATQAVLTCSAPTRSRMTRVVRQLQQGCSSGHPWHQSSLLSTFSSVVSVESER